jgi:metallo-beta-lactamase family protein
LVRIHGDAIRVAATVHTLGGLSAHGDQEDLVRWYGAFAGRPPVCLVHGEPDAALGLQRRLATLGTRVTVPAPGDRMDLGALPALAGAPDFDMTQAGRE